jgi:hypothetical protein
MFVNYQTVVLIFFLFKVEKPNQKKNTYNGPFDKAVLS